MSEVVQFLQFTSGLSSKESAVNFELLQRDKQTIVHFCVRDRLAAFKNEQDNSTHFLIHDIH